MRELDSLRDRWQSINENTRGDGVSADSMARVGGSIGSSRAGLGVADRQMQIQREAAKIQVEIRDINRRMEEHLANLDAGPGGER
jgi:hypothetical protein